MHQDRLGIRWLKKSVREKDLGFLVVITLILSETEAEDQQLYELHEDRHWQRDEEGDSSSLFNPGEIQRELGLLNWRRDGSGGSHQCVEVSDRSI